MLRSLRSKLIVAFAFIIFVCLLSAGTAFVLFLRDHEIQQARERVGRLAEPLALEVTYLEWVGLTAEEIRPVLDDYAERLNVRLLLVDKATSQVVADTGGRLLGKTLQEFESSSAGTEKVGSIWVWQIRFREYGENLVMFTPLDRVTGSESPNPSLLSRFRTVVAVPEEDITSAWLDILPRLSIAGSIALVISVAIAFILSLATAFNSMAQEVNRSQRTLRQFLADASHELRTPLTSIQGFSQAMAEGTIETPQELADSARIINDEAQRMRALVDDLLYLSQIETGQAVIQKEPLDLEDLLRTCVERFERQAQEKGLKIQVDVPPLSSLEGDVRRLEQVFSNLLDNAVRHTPQEGTVTLRAEESDAAVRVAVHNTGSLIPEDDLPHVFERFYQVNRSATEGHTGLGLAIASEVVQAHGGSISARSAEQEGTEFTVTLPLAGRET